MRGMINIKREKKIYCGMNGTLACLGSTVLWMPRAMIIHLLAALELRLLASINNTQACPRYHGST